MTKRFDRDENTKHHLRTLYELAHRDYRQKATHDVSQILLTIDRLGLGYAASEEAFRRIAFNVMATNCERSYEERVVSSSRGRTGNVLPSHGMTCSR